MALKIPFFGRGKRNGGETVARPASPRAGPLVLMPNAEPAPAASPQAPPEPGKSWRLEVQAGPQAGQLFDLEDGIEIGRLDTSAICLRSDIRVSRSHASLHLVADGLEIRDRKSANGTSVNGRLIDQPAALNPGDIITVGKTDLKVLAVEAPAPAPRPNADNRTTLFSAVPDGAGPVGKAVCPACRNPVELRASYCSSCGKKL
jgi:hypothetical protein